jgi:membrane-associated protease RseP (regulator of RpoE activity)
VTAFAWTLGVVVFVLGIGASIALHEVGHLLPAKRFGVKVTQYMVGFGGTLWSRRRGDTEYGVKWIPLGGYIRMIGMFPPRAGDAPGTLRVSSTGRFSQLADEARQLSLEEIKPGDEDRVFYKLSVLKRVIIMLGGPMMNLLIAVVLLTGLVTLYGVSVPKPGAKVASVSECVVPAAEATTKTACATTDPKTPAYQAGIHPGDVLVSVNGAPVQKPADVGELIRPRAGEPTTIVVRRDGKDLSLTATPVRNQVQRISADGSPMVDEAGQPVTTEAGFLGVSSAPPLAIERQPLSVVPQVVGQQLSATAGLVLKIPQKMKGVAEAAFGSGARDPNGPVSVVGIGRFAGEASSGGIQGIGGENGIAPLAFLLQLIAGLNMALFVFNMIPLLPLDGGHVAGALYEGARRRVAKLFGRPDPGAFDIAKLLPVTYLVAVLLMGMGALLIYADIVKPVNLFG